MKKAALLIPLIFLSCSLSWVGEERNCEEVITEFEGEARSILNAYKKDLIKGCTEDTMFYYDPDEIEYDLNARMGFLMDNAIKGFEEGDYSGAFYNLGLMNKIVFDSSFPSNCLKYSEPLYYSNLKEGLNDVPRYNEFYASIVAEKRDYGYKISGDYSSVLKENWEYCRGLRFEGIRAFVSENHADASNIASRIYSRSVDTTAFFWNETMSAVELDSSFATRKRIIDILIIVLEIIPFPIAAFLVFRFIKKGKIKLHPKFSGTHVSQTTAIYKETREENWLTAQFKKILKPLWYDILLKVTGYSEKFMNWYNRIFK